MNVYLATDKTIEDGGLFEQCRWYMTTTKRGNIIYRMVADWWYIQQTTSDKVFVFYYFFRKIAKIISRQMDTGANANSTSFDIGVQTPISQN